MKAKLSKQNLNLEAHCELPLDGISLAAVSTGSVDTRSVLTEHLVERKIGLLYR